MGSLPCQNLAILASCITMAIATGFFEYGSRMAGDELAFEYRGQIPVLQNEYRLSVRHNRTDLYLPYTYLRVEFGRKMSKVDTLYDYTHMILIFNIEYALLPIDIGVTGYALKMFGNTITV